MFYWNGLERMMDILLALKSHWSNVTSLRLYFIICLFALLINKVSAETENLVGVIGRSTILPCFFSNSGNTVTEIDVRWRHNKTLNVCDITDGKCSGEHQAAGYKNRTEVFPEEFVNGNFSLKLSHLTSTDAGEYQCFIIHSSELVKLQLRLNESTADKADPTTETRLMSRIIIPVLSFVLLLLVCVIIFTYKKRCYKSSSSGVSANGGHLSDNDSLTNI
ncbi:butyrophilin subfamily 3 member A3-like [Paramisgurnus dabryanus]|uniref:butyrophilin subfamily 3 member A3-like n=1 Tax=Paramisgurnus dabryanus TaxID=90735 RepID=UPI0031F46F57